MHYLLFEQFNIHGWLFIQWLFHGSFEGTRSKGFLSPLLTSGWWLKTIITDFTLIQVTVQRPLETYTSAIAATQFIYFHPRTEPPARPPATKYWRARGGVRRNVCIQIVTMRVDKMAFLSLRREHSFLLKVPQHDSTVRDSCLTLCLRSRMYV